MSPPTEMQRRDLLEVLEDSFGNRSTLCCSQLPVVTWHAQLGDPTLADALLDRLVHNAYRLVLKGLSHQKKRTPKIQTPPNEEHGNSKPRPRRFAPKAPTRSAVTMPWNGRSR